MSLLVDRYRPYHIDDLNYNIETSKRLQAIAESKNIPHMLFYGPSGSGKKTRVMAMLRVIYGEAIDKIKMTQKVFTTPSGKYITLNILSSTYHIEVNIGDIGTNDRFITQGLLKELAQTRSVASMFGVEYKIVILSGADCLSADAQNSLRRTMEKYVSNMRLFFICNNLGKIIEPIRSRSILVRVPSPSDTDIKSILRNICKKEDFETDEKMLIVICKNSRGNLRKAILLMELYFTKPTDDNLESDWELFIRDLANYIIQEQTPQRLLATRTRLYELLSSCIPPSIIMKTLACCLLDVVEDSIKTSIVADAAFYESRIVRGMKSIFHLEAFIAKFMAVYKNYLLSMTE